MMCRFVELPASESQLCGAPAVTRSGLRRRKSSVVQLSWAFEPQRFQESSRGPHSVLALPK